MDDDDNFTRALETSADLKSSPQILNFCAEASTHRPGKETFAWSKSVSFKDFPRMVYPDPKVNQEYMGYFPLNPPLNVLEGFIINSTTVWNTKQYGVWPVEKSLNVEVAGINSSSDDEDDDSNRIRNIYALQNIYLSTDAPPSYNIYDMETWENLRKFLLWDSQSTNSETTQNQVINGMWVTSPFLLGNNEKKARILLCGYCSSTLA